MSFISPSNPLRRRLFSWSRPVSPRRKRRAAELPWTLHLEPLEARDLLTGTWTPLVNLAPSTTGTMLLLSDGTVMVQGGGVSNAWYRLTPDAAGSYSDGTWSQRASMSLQRQYFASNVLPDGQVLILGGEYSGSQGQATWTHTAEMYDPATDSWSGAASFPQSRFGDDPSELLPDGRVLAGYLSGPQTYIYDPGSNTWSEAGDKVAGDRSDEETWVKLPDDSILSYDIFNNGHAQRYLPALDQWEDTGPVPVDLSGAAVQNELGPAFLLPDGRAFFIGATNHTALYDPATDTWSAGPDLPDGMGADDAPGAELPNGHIIFAADHVPESYPTSLFDFDPTTDSLSEMAVPDAVGLSGKNAFGNRMLVLPTGEVLFSNGSNQLFVYTPDGSPDPSWQPVIDQVTDNGDGSFLLTGWQLNGISEGASYGDDAEMASNYPLVRLTDDAGSVHYATTYNWSSTGVATGDAEVSVLFQPPAGLAAGHYSLTVVANGIASDPVDFDVPDATAYHPVDVQRSTGRVPLFEAVVRVRDESAERRTFPTPVQDAAPTGAIREAMHPALLDNLAVRGPGAARTSAMLSFGVRNVDRPSVEVGDALFADSVLDAWSA